MMQANNMWLEVRLLTLKLCNDVFFIFNPHIIRCEFLSVLQFHRLRSFSDFM